MQAPVSRDLRAVVMRCAEPRQTRNPSQLVIVDDDDDGRIVAIPVRAAQEWHFSALTARGASVTLTGTVWSFSPDSSERGALFAQTFTNTGGDSFTAAPPKRLAPGCTQADLAVTVAQRGVGARLRVRNHSSTACVVEGYPTVAGVTASGRLVPAVAAEPAATALGDDVAEVLLLAPGEAATASMITAATPAASDCAALIRLQVALGSGALLDAVPTTLGVCSLRVQPFVADPSG